MIPADILAGLAALASLGNTIGSAGAQRAPGADGAMSAFDFPSLDPLMALGTSSPLFATLAQWQKIDLRAAIARLAPPPAEGEAAGAVVPLNLVPHIRAAVAEQISNPADAISVDVIGLLFDYIFRDPTIPESTRALFGRLQVPIVKAALLDRAFFADKKHPARQLLDHLADAAVGAGNDEAYRAAFEAIAQKAIDQVCADFEIDVAVFRDADRSLLSFAEQERQKSAAALAGDVAEALHAEKDEADRAVVRALLRDRLAGLDVPFEVRSFIETIWADYLAALRREHGVDSPPWNAALATLDDMLWSIVAKERTAQKARLSKLIPSLIGGLRAGCRSPVGPGRTFEGILRGALRAAHGGDQARAGRAGARSRNRRRGGSRGCRTAPAGERARLRRRNGRRHVAALRSRRGRGRRAPELGQPAARQIHLHQPLAFACVRSDAGGAGLETGQRNGEAGGRARAAVGPRGQLRPRLARRAQAARARPRRERSRPRRVPTARAIPGPRCR